MKDDHNHPGSGTQPNAATHLTDCFWGERNTNRIIALNQILNLLIKCRT